eukprot:COSAG06_NODE_9324_length_1929_cov_1.789617_1_plen_246_part_00
METFRKLAEEDAVQIRKEIERIVARIDIQQASASRPADRDSVLEAVENSVGCDALNDFCQEIVRMALLDAAGLHPDLQSTGQLTPRDEQSLEQLQRLTPRELKQQAISHGASQDEIDALDDCHDVKAAAIELVQHTQLMKGAGTSAASAGWSETVLARLASKADELRQQRENGNPTKTPQEIEIRRAVGLMHGRLYAMNPSTPRGRTGLAELEQARDLGRRFYGPGAQVVAEIEDCIQMAKASRR